jgi:Na+-transporting NADH:ubiquinone oxidoreductase subunit NqrC
MPLLEYFVVVGIALIAGLFVADYYVPAPPPAKEAREIDKTSIRIHSTQKTPGKLELTAVTF